MIALIRNKGNGLEHVEKHVQAITAEAGQIKVEYDGDWGVVSGCRFDADTYEVIKVRKE